ncbi:hypothetical protein BpHYR1_050454 [Brachionus plicatilis]|uniref:Uncharacterized protein n=1 Tax=Brachionus plicatilis TaxID=10195 RepID=A0A3M7QFY6_BRAPC|nr:hypothetical protein BpHYR1_050454 [Brachionus plicatilis]
MQKIAEFLHSLEFPSCAITLQKLCNFLFYFLYIKMRINLRSRENGIIKLKINGSLNMDNYLIREL